MAFTIWNDSKSKRRLNLTLIEEIYEFVCDEYSKLEKAYSFVVWLLVWDILRALTEKMLQTHILNVCNQSGFESRNFNRFSAFIWYTYGDVHFISDILQSIILELISPKISNSDEFALIMILLLDHTVHEYYNFFALVTRKYRFEIQILNLGLAREYRPFHKLCFRGNIQ